MPACSRFLLAHDGEHELAAALLVGSAPLMLPVSSGRFSMNQRKRRPNPGSRSSNSASMTSTANSGIRLTIEWIFGAADVAAV